MVFRYKNVIENNMKKTLLIAAALLVGCSATPERITTGIVDIIAAQHLMQPKNVNLDMSFREFGRDNGLQDEMNYVEVILTIEDKYKIKLPDNIVLVKTEEGMELIPKEATPRWLIQVVREQQNLREGR